MGIVCNEVSDVTMASPVMNLKTRRTLKGHRGKILHFDWSPDKRHLVTAGQVKEASNGLGHCLHFTLTVGWFCCRLERIYSTERGLGSDHLTLGAFLCLFSFYHPIGLWVSALATKLGLKMEVGGYLRGKWVTESQKMAPSS